MLAFLAGNSKQIDLIEVRTGTTARRHVMNRVRKRATMRNATTTRPAKAPRRLPIDSLSHTSMSMLQLSAPSDDVALTTEKSLPQLASERFDPRSSLIVDARSDDKVPFDHSSQTTMRLARIYYQERRP